MDTPRKVIVGYDLCDDFTQICCYSYKTMEPIPISVQEGEEDYRIPTALGVKTETRQWLFGEEAVRCAAAGTGVLVEHLLEKVQAGEEVEILGQSFTGITVFEKYLRKTLTLIKNYFPTEPITKLVVTVRNTEPVFVDKVYEALAMLGIEKDRAVVMSHAGVYLYYALCQDKSLWMNDVGLFDFNEEGLGFYQIHMNRRSIPMVAGLTKTDYSDTLNFTMLKQLKSRSAGISLPVADPSSQALAGRTPDGINIAYIFENIANKALYKQIITTLYFTGCGFEGGWAEDTIKGLCVGRRVFLGQNLYTKGACYAAKELSGDRTLGDFILLSDDMVTKSISVRVYSDASYKDIMLTQAGENWYEVNKCIEVIPEGDAELEIVLKNIMTRDITRKSIPLNQFPKRPDRMTRLKLALTCRDKSTAIITITDLGFGDIYPGSEQTMELSVEI